MTDDNRQTNAHVELRSAKEAIRAASALMEIGTLRDAMSRAYYAAFHAARALLLLHGVQAKTHGGLVHLFNERVVLGGQIEPRYNLLLTRLQAYRHASDYAYLFTMEAGDVATEVEAAREFVERAEALIDKTS